MTDTIKNLQEVREAIYPFAIYAKTLGAMFSPDEIDDRHYKDCLACEEAIATLDAVIAEMSAQVMGEPSNGGTRPPEDAEATGAEGAPTPSPAPTEAQPAEHWVEFTKSYPDAITALTEANKLLAANNLPLCVFGGGGGGTGIDPSVDSQANAVLSALHSRLLRPTLTPEQREDIISEMQAASNAEYDKTMVKPTIYYQAMKAAYLVAEKRLLGKGE